MSVITREIINKDIVFEDRNGFVGTKIKTYNYNDLSREIDKFKNLLKNHKAKKDNNIIIGIQPSLEQIACVFACMELGITISIVDYHRPDSFQQYKYMDPKTEILSPIDFFIVNYRNESDKFNFFHNKSRKTIICNEQKNFDYTTNYTVDADENTNLITCTSSGTTNTPKKIIHKHNFLYKLIKRNSLFFDKTVSITFNLNHGSSLATYFLPSLVSKKVDKIVNIKDFLSCLKFENIDINHILLPYRNYLEISSEYYNPNTIFYTLSIISNELVKNYQNGNFKDIISFFGSNETSGPTLINQISKKNFQEESYHKIDNFYNLKIVKSELNVILPIYNTTINTNDLFETKDNNEFVFKGRNDIKRINGLNVDKNLYDSICKETMDCDIVYDIAHQYIYLAIWKNYSDIFERFLDLDKKIRKISKNCHYIDKSRILDKKEFLTGIKLDQELLREYFRKNVIKLK